eukprot:m51a1_g7125 hypothetical protein (119) ;mRNA; r:158591-161482
MGRLNSFGEEEVLLESAPCDGHNYSLLEFAKAIPYVTRTDGEQGDVGSFIIAFLTSFVLSSLVPVIVNTIVQEKQQPILALYSGWGVNQVALSFLLSAFDRTRTASISWYVLVTLCCI